MIDNGRFKYEINRMVEMDEAKFMLKNAMMVFLQDFELGESKNKAIIAIACLVFRNIYLNCEKGEIRIVYRDGNLEIHTNDNYGYYVNTDNLKKVMITFENKDYYGNCLKDVISICQQFNFILDLRYSLGLEYKITVPDVIKKPA